MPFIRGPLLTLCLAFLAGLSLLVLLAPAANAQEESSIKGTLETVSNEERVPVEGVSVTVAQDGVVVGTAVSAGDGTWQIVVPGGGVYEVELDVESLPDGVAPTDPERMSLPEVTVQEGQSKSVRFNLGPGITSEISDFERLKSLSVLGLKLGAIIALAAVGLSLVFGVTGLVNFSHGELITIGAVLVFFFHSAEAGPGWPLLVAVIPAILLAGAFGSANELILWRPLRKRRVGTIAMLVISIGLAFAIRNVILIIMGGEPQTYSDYVIQDEVSFLGITTTPKNLVIIGGSLLILGAVGLFLIRTRAGIAVRAVSDSSDLAEASGIDVNRVIHITWILGAGLAGLAGVLLGVSEKVQWDMGFKVLLLIFAAVVLGGLGTAFGAMLGGFIVGFAVEVSTFWIDTELKNAVALAVLVVMLLWRPQGLLGKRERIG